MAYLVHAKRRLGVVVSFFILEHKMNGQAPFRTYFSDGGYVARMTIQALQAAGMTVVRSFDLRSACAPRSDNVCPHDGEADCDCRLMVLLVYTGTTEPPTSLVLHSHRGQTELYWDGNAVNLQQTDRKALILAALDSCEALQACKGREDLVG